MVRTLENHMPTKLTPEIITAAIVGFESQKTHIDAKIAELRALLPGGSTQTAATPDPAKRKVSTAARRKMALAQKARWSKVRGESEPTQAAAPPTKPKRKLSKAGRAAIVAATKARWDRVRAAKTKPAATKRIAAKKTAVQTAPAKAAKRAPVKKATATKKTAPAA